MIRISEISLGSTNIYWGVCDPLFPNIKEPPLCEYSYMACVEVENFYQVPEGMRTKTILAGRYAVFTHQGKLDALEKTLRCIYKESLTKSGEKQRSSPGSYVKKYDDQFKSTSADSEVDLYIAIQ